jgi:hypothetical protein
VGPLTFGPPKLQKLPVVGLGRVLRGFKVSQKYLLGLEAQLAAPAVGFAVPKDSAAGGRAAGCGRASRRAGRGNWRLDGRPRGLCRRGARSRWRKADTLMWLWSRRRPAGGRGSPGAAHPAPNMGNWGRAPPLRPCLGSPVLAFEALSLGFTEQATLHTPAAEPCSTAPRAAGGPGGCSGWGAVAARRARSWRSGPGWRALPSLAGS